MKEYLLALGLTVSCAANAQTSCPPPVLQVLYNNQPVPSTGFALMPKATLQVRLSPECAGNTSYQFRQAEVTLMRGRRPLTQTVQVRQPEVDLSYFKNVAQPGDRLYVFIRYENLVVVSVDGKKSPYPHPTLGAEKQRGLDLNTDEAKGIGFTWMVR